jgi:hypothetical protein
MFIQAHEYYLRGEPDPDLLTSLVQSFHTATTMNKSVLLEREIRRPITILQG